MEPQDKVEEGSNQQLQSAIPGVRPVRQEKKKVRSANHSYAANGASVACFVLGIQSALHKWTKKIASHRALLVG